MAKKNKSKEYLYNNGLNDDKNFVRRCQKLATAWQKRLEAPLAKRQRLFAAWASGFFDDSYGREHMINLIDRGVSTIVPFLVEGNPRLMVETKVAGARSWAFTTQLALNFLIKEMNLSERVLIPAAINSMFGAGIVRTFTEYDRRISLGQDVIKAGRPVIRVIDDADYIGDVAAKTRDDFVIEGDIYKLPTEYARDLFQDYADYIHPDCKLTSDYHPEKIASGEWDINRLSLREYTTFMDLYLYDENITITILPQNGCKDILRIVEEDGADESPYDFLGYSYFPGSTYPIPPVWKWHDLDVTMNILAKTAKEQAESQKDIIFANYDQEQLIKKVANAKNMDILLCSDPVNSINKISFGGVNPDNYNWMNFAELEFTKSGANPDVLGGRGAQAPTYGQEQLVYANATRIVNNMYTRWHNFMTSIVKKLAWRVWTDPKQYIPLIHEIPGVGERPVVFSKADKVGDFYNFVFNLIPYSSQRQSPELKYQQTMGFLTQWILPTYQMAAQQGAQLDVPTVTNILSTYLGLDTFNQWYKTVTPDMLQDVGYQMQPSDKKNKYNQANDTFGKTQPSQMANMFQQQERTTGSAEGNTTTKEK
ncbi:MAG: hypothetical protein P8016_09470 [Sedimentisphaerales bacterium]